MHDKIAFLYPDRAAEVHQRLQRLLAAFAEKRPSRGERSPRFNESDVVLICYGDHVRQAGVPTIVTLSRFLDRYAKGLIPRVHILPFYPYSSDDGFSVIDYYRVKDELGDWNDIEPIVANYDLMFDLVINHASADSIWFRRFLAGDPDRAEYFIAFDEPVDVSTVFRPRTHPLLTPFETAKGTRYVWTTFSADQIDVNFANPDVLLDFVKILLYYIERGARIIRLDAIAYLWKQLGTSCLHLPQTHMVVKLLRQILDTVAPEVWIITETNVPHQENISYFGNGTDEAHLVYNFALPPLLLYSLLNGDASLLSRWASTLSPPSKDTAFFNFTASHDGIGVTALRSLTSAAEFERVVESTRELGGRVGFRAVPGKEPVPYELNIVYLDAVGGLDPFLASQAIALALQGVPAIYFNSFVGARNWEEGVTQLGYNRAINRQKFQLADLTDRLDTPGAIEARVYQGLTRMLRARRTEPLFSPLAGQRVLEADPAVFALLRFDGARGLAALTNVSGESVSLNSGTLTRELGATLVTNLLSEEADGAVINLERELFLAPYQTAWLRPATEVE